MINKEKAKVTKQKSKKENNIKMKPKFKEQSICKDQIKGQSEVNDSSTSSSNMSSIRREKLKRLHQLICFVQNKLYTVPSAITNLYVF